MSFITYLNESEDASEIELDAFIDKIKKEKLYGYDVLKHISEADLRKVLEDDEYFDSKMKSSGEPEKISEMVIKPGNEPEKKEFSAQQKKLSLAVRLGLKQDDKSKVEDEDTEEQDNKAPNVLNKPGGSMGSSSNSNLSFADRMRADIERRNQERAERQKQEQEIRDNRAKQAEEESNDRNEPLSFNGKSMEDQKDKDNAVNDKTNDDLDKKLTNHMFKKTRTTTNTDEDGYKRVRNLGSLGDKAAAEKLQKAMDSRFPKDEVEKDKKEDSEYQKDGHVTKPVRKKTNTEYSKRTLLAIADRMDFDVFCKFKKLNGDTRTGNFRIGKTESQITQKQNSIICIDLDLSKQENKTVWRTINLDKIIQIVPI